MPAERPRGDSGPGGCAGGCSGPTWPDLRQAASGPRAARAEAPGSPRGAWGESESQAESESDPSPWAPGPTRRRCLHARWPHGGRRPLVQSTAPSPRTAAGLGHGVAGPGRTRIRGRVSQQPLLGHAACLGPASQSAAPRSPARGSGALQGGSRACPALAGGGRPGCPRAARSPRSAIADHGTRISGTGFDANTTESGFGSSTT